MKKLTAGVFAAILTVVGATGARADMIASSDWVTSQLNTATSTITNAYEAADANLTDEIGKKANAADVYVKSEVYTKSEANTLLDAKATTQALAVETSARETLAGRVATAEGKIGTGDLPTAEGYGDLIQSVNTLKGATDTMASDETVTNLTGRVATLEGDNTTNKKNIATNTDNIAAAAEKIGTGTLPAGEGFEDLTAAVNTLVASDQEFATGFNERIQETDDAVDANTAAITALQNAGYATTGQVATAKQEAISAAAEDATTKADAAESNAKTYADGLNTTMGTRVAALEAIDHTTYATTEALTKAQTTLQGNIDAKVATTTFDEFKTSNTAAIGTAKSEAIVDAESKVNALANGAVKTNTDNIATLTGDNATNKSDIAQLKTDVVAAKSTADTGVANAATAQAAAEAAQATASQGVSDAAEALEAANAKIPEPAAECSNPTNKCVLVSSGKGNYAWEVIARATTTPAS